MKRLLKFKESLEDSIESRVINAVKRCIGKNDELKPSTTFKELELFEVDLVEILIFLEEEFNIEITDTEEIDNIFKSKKYLDLDINFLIKIVMDIR